MVRVRNASWELTNWDVHLPFHSKNCRALVNFVLRYDIQNKTRKIFPMSRLFLNLLIFLMFIFISNCIIFHLYIIKVF